MTPLAGASLSILLAISPAAASAALAPAEGPLRGGQTITFDAPSPPDPPKIVRISGGNHSSLAIGDDSRIYGWGGNGDGEVGSAEPGSQVLPVRTQTPAGVTFDDVAVGSFTSYAVGSDEKTYAWGSGQHGALGNGSTGGSSQAPSEVKLPTGTKFTRVIAGTDHAFGIDESGNAFAWGTNASRQLGDGSFTYVRATPVPVLMPAGVTFTDLSALAEHTLAVGSDGNTYAWGTNSAGLLGTSSLPRPLDRPTKVTTPPGVKYTQVAAAWDFSVALGTDGKLYSWGSNYQGALGNGSDEWESRVPVRAATPPGVLFQRVVSGGGHVLALTVDGQIYAWGSNSHGELGSGTTSPSGSPTPVLVKAPAGVTFVGISAGSGTSFARGSDGLSYSWGNNAFGQLGDGTRTDLAAPSPVLPPEMKSTVTGVTFGDRPGTKITQDDSGLVSVQTPAGEKYGPVDVGVEWTVNGERQDPVSLPQAYLYGDAPHVTALVSQESQLGAEAEFSTHPSGSPSPELAWEFSLDGGGAWLPISEDSAVRVSDDGQTLSVSVAPQHEQVLYRVVATNALGTARTLPAELRVPSRTVSFDSTGGSPVDAQSVLSGGTVNEPEPAPERSEFEFVRWVDTSGVPFDFSAPIVGDTTVFADWRASALPTFDVSFDLAGGSGTFPQQSIEAGGKVVSPADTPTRDGYAFTGWTLDGAIYNFEAPVERDLSLVAGWQAVIGDTHTVTFDPANGNAPFAVHVAHGDGVSAPADPVRESFQFTGWTHGDSPYDFESAVVSDITLTAGWEQIPLPMYTVTFNPGNGDEPSIQQVVAGSPAPQPQHPVRDGYVFAGWLLDGAEYDFTTPVVSDLVILAHWETEPAALLTVTFDPANGSESFTQEVPSGEPVSRPADPVRTGFTFTGWAADGVVYDFASPVTSDVFLMADWEPTAVPPTTRPPVPPPTTQPPVAPPPPAIAESGGKFGAISIGLAAALLALGATCWLFSHRRLQSR